MGFFKGDDNTNTTSTYTPAPYVDTELRNAMAGARGLFDEGPVIPHFAGLTGKAMWTAADAAKNQIPQIQQQLQGSLRNFLNPQDDPNVRGQVSFATDEILRSLDRSRGATGAGATSAGQFGGSRHGVAEALATEAAQQQIGGTAANILGNAYNTGVGAYTNLFGQQTGLLKDQANLYATAGQMKEDREDEIANAPAANLDAYISRILAMAPSAGGTTRGAVNPPSQAGYKDWASGLSSILGIAGMF
jgi:hypothetical protein